MGKTLNYWQRQRQKSGWAGGYVEWIDGNTAYISVVFSWQMNRAYQRAVWLRQEGYKVCAGGPAVSLNPSVLEDVAELGREVNALQHHNPNATFTSRGCPRKCEFCAVPKIEGDLYELGDWKPKPIVCDNNLLACSRAHFDTVIDRLKPISKIDFNQGLDARLLSNHHANRLAELDLAVVRLAWDDIGMEAIFRQAIAHLQKAGITNDLIRVYILIGFRDTPEDALYRLQIVYNMGLLPNPMRYQPLDSIKRNQYVAPNWTHRELMRYMRYWTNLIRVGHIPFAEWA